MSDGDNLPEGNYIVIDGKAYLPADQAAVLLERAVQAETAALYYGEHSELCAAPPNATKVHPSCTCGFSDFLTGRGVNKHFEIYREIAQRHRRGG